MMRKYDIGKFDKRHKQSYYVIDENTQPLENDKPFRWTLSKIFMLFAFAFGIFVLIINIYHLFYLAKWKFEEAPFLPLQQRRKAAWIYAKKTSHLRHVVMTLELAGYSVMQSLSPPQHWDVLWAYDFPFERDFDLTNVENYQKVNHFPGSGHLTLKVSLVTSTLRWSPLAFSMPGDKGKLLKVAEKNPEKLWVQKSNNHRGIKILNVKDLQLDTKHTFVQEFVERPLLIDRRKFDIGVYVVVTSVDPLLVYLYTEELLVRFCTVDYEPLDVNNSEKYVVADAYTGLEDMPSLRDYYNKQKMSFKDSLFTHLAEKGFDTEKIWNEIQKCIAQMFITKEKQMRNALKGFSNRWNFFELVRVDFVLDEQANVWLMEVNMSPNLSSNTHTTNALMYQKVVHNTLALVGVSTHIVTRADHDNDVIASSQDVLFTTIRCKTEQCMRNCEDKLCRLCYQCLSKETLLFLKKAHREHRNRGGYERVLPVPMKPSTDLVYDDVTIEGLNNELISHWFKEKCLRHSHWCS